MLRLTRKTATWRGCYQLLILPVQRKPRDGSGKVHWWIPEADLLKLQKIGQFPDEPVRSLL
jgi:hypothetical protein